MKTCHKCPPSQPNSLREGYQLKTDSELISVTFGFLDFSASPPKFLTLEEYEKMQQMPEGET